MHLCTTYGDKGRSLPSCVIRTGTWCNILSLSLPISTNLTLNYTFRFYSAQIQNLVGSFGSNRLENLEIQVQIFKIELLNPKSKPNSNSPNLNYSKTFSFSPSFSSFHFSFSPWAGFPLPSPFLARLANSTSSLPRAASGPARCVVSAHSRARTHTPSAVR